MPVVIGGKNLPSPVRIGLTDLKNIGEASGPPGSPSSGITGNNSLRTEDLEISRDCPVVSDPHKFKKTYLVHDEVNYDWRIV